MLKDDLVKYLVIVFDPNAVRAFDQTQPGLQAGSTFLDESKDPTRLWKALPFAIDLFVVPSGAETCVRGIATLRLLETPEGVNYDVRSFTARICNVKGVDGAGVITSDSIQTYQTVIHRDLRNTCLRYGVLPTGSERSRAIVALGKDGDLGRSRHPVPWEHL